jgi:hypothetical protein
LDTFWSYCAKLVGNPVDHPHCCAKLVVEFGSDSITSSVKRKIVLFCDSLSGVFTVLDQDGGGGGGAPPSMYCHFGTRGMPVKDFFSLDDCPSSTLMV